MLLKVAGHAHRSLWAHGRMLVLARCILQLLLVACHRNLGKDLAVDGGERNGPDGGACCVFVQGE